MIGGHAASEVARQQLQALAGELNPFSHPGIRKSRVQNYKSPES
jgi:hypothetical protein